MPPDDTFVLAGTYLGDVKMFNMKTGAEESSYNCHDSQVTNLQVRPLKNHKNCAYEIKETMVIV